MKKLNKITSNRIFKCKWNEIEKYQPQLRRVSGLYYWYDSSSSKLLYVGEATNLYRRMKQYQNDKQRGNNNKGLVNLIESQSDSLMIAFQLIDSQDMNKKEFKRYLKQREAMFIQNWLPLLNIDENPRYLIHPIQKVIGRIVLEQNREIAFKEMRKYLFEKWQGEIPYERIDEALANKRYHLSNYCKTSQKEKTLTPKEIKIA